MATILWALVVLLAAQEGRPARSFRLAAVDRVTALPAIRQHVTVAPRDGAGLVVWEEAGGLDRNGQPLPPVHLAVLRPHDPQSATVRYSSAAGNQMGPALADCFGRLWLAWYEATPDRQTGDRDVMLLPVEGSGPDWERAVAVTRDRRGSGPVNDASPSLACDPAGRQLLIVWSSGRYDPRQPGGYQDKDVMLAALDSAGRPGPARRLTTARDLLREMTPALAVLPPAAGGGYLLAFIGDTAGSGEYDLFLRRYDREWRLLRARRITSGGGVSHPSLALLDDTTVLLWLDHRATDVRLAPVAPDLSVTTPLSLRGLLAGRMRALGLDSLAAVFGATLRPDQGGLALPFIAGVGRDVYLARLAPADSAPR